MPTITYSTIVSDLANVTPAEGDVASTIGCLAPNDQGGGIWLGVTGNPGDFSTNKGTVVVPTGGDGSKAWVRRFNGPAHLTWFGGNADASGADNTCALQAAVDACASIVIGAGTHHFASSVQLPARCQLSGVNRHATVLTVDWNGVLFPDLDDEVQISSLSFDGDGATHSESGFATISGTKARQLIENCTLTNSGGYILEFTNETAGSQFRMTDCTVSRHDGTSATRYAVRVEDEPMADAIPRDFDKIQTNGTLFIELGGSNSCYIGSGYYGGLLFSSNSRGVLISRARLADPSGLTIAGSNHALSACNIAQNTSTGICLTLQTGATAVSVQGCTFNSVFPVLDSSGQGSLNLIDHRVMIFVPPISAAGGGFSLGNGDARASFTRTGGTVNLQMELTVGSTTNLGTGVLRFSLLGSVNSGITSTSLGNALVPVTGVAQTQMGEGLIQSGANRRLLVARAVQSQTYISLFSEGGGEVTGAAPFTLAAGDFIRFSISYIL